MKAAPFEYRVPETLDEALSLRAEHAEDSVILSGGQSLVPMLNLRFAQPEVVIDLNRVAGLDDLHQQDAAVAIGARVTQRALERSALVAELVPLLAAAVPFVGHPAIRSRGTIGGSVAHADPAAELPAVVLALDGQLVARSAARGERVIPANEFFHGFLTTALEPDEILVEVRLPMAASASGVAVHEVARSHGAFALVGAAALIQMRDDVVAEARLALIGVGSTPVRAHAAEALIVGSKPSDESLRKAAATAAEALEPPTDVHADGAYRRRVAAVLARRALSDAAVRAGEAVVT